MSEPVTEDELLALREFAKNATKGPWRAMVEGRDHESGDSFIMIGDEDDRDEDMYLLRETKPASAADLDFIAAARNLVPKLLSEIDRLRGAR